MRDESPVCLLTGAGGRLGVHFCHNYADRFRIAAICRSRVPGVPSQTQSFVDPLDPAAIIPANDRPVFIVTADLARDGEIERAVELVLARFRRIDVIINAAGVRTRGSLVSSRPLLEGLAEEFTINTLLPLRLTHHVAMKNWRSDGASTGRSVVNLSCVGALELRLGEGDSVFAASKAALTVMTCHMAHELTHLGARVNAVAADDFPAAIPVQRVADAVLTLVDGDMNGRVLGVYSDGSEYVL
jgi:NAD(P)-dependent dehydrogenase (short-subunit alcohol dehydrogenase family)